MSVRLFADGNTGTVAIYTDAQIDDAPVNNPLANVSRLRYHSDLEYPRVVSVRTGSFTMPAIGANLIYRQTHLLFAHGLSFTPFVEGYAGSGVPLSGSVPIVVGSSNPSTDAAGFCRWVHLGATPSHVVIQEYSLTPIGSGFGASTIEYKIFVTDTSV